MRSCLKRCSKIRWAATEARRVGGINAKECASSSFCRTIGAEKAISRPCDSSSGPESPSVRRTFGKISTLIIFGVTLRNRVTVAWIFEFTRVIVTRQHSVRAIARIIPPKNPLGTARRLSRARLLDRVTLYCRSDNDQAALDSTPSPTVGFDGPNKNPRPLHKPRASRARE